MNQSELIEALPDPLEYCVGVILETPEKVIQVNSRLTVRDNIGTPGY